MKKLVIVGGGIGGLTAGVYGMLEGFDTSIYEKNAVVGGECTGWNRGGYYIDNCIHWLMGTAPGSDLYDVWKTTGAVGDGVEIIHHDNMYSSELDGQRITLWKDIEKTRAEMLRLSPEDETEINDLIKSCKLAEHIQIPAGKPPEMMNPIELFRMMGKTKGAMKLFGKYKGMDNQDLMNRFKHPLLKAVLSDFCTRESLASSFPMSYGNFTGGDGGVPRGGSRAMAIRMGEKFKSLGGKLFLSSPVQKVELDGDKARGITLFDGTFVEADYVVCACDTDFTFGKLLDKKYMPELFREMYANSDAYPVYGMFQVAFAVDSPVDAIKGDVNIEAGEAKYEEWVGDRINVKNFAYEPKFAPEGKQIVQVMLGQSDAGYEYWKSLYEDKDKYDRKKAEIASIIMRKVEDRFPEYKGKMTVLDTWTPMTYKRYCNAYRGYNQAFMPTKKSRPNPYASCFIDGLDNVLLCGQWLNPPGGLPGAATSGKFAIYRLLKKIGGKPKYKG